MTEWRNLRMRDLMVEFHDGPHATPAAATDGPVYLGIKNITDTGALDLRDVRHIAEEDFATWTRRVTPLPGDVVFTYEATLHRYALIPQGFRGCLGRRLALIRVDPAVVLPRFLHYVLLGPQWRATVTDRIISGSTVDRVPIISFPDFPIAIPDLRTQHGIVETLGSIDDLIDNNRRRIDLLEQMAQAIYREWFVRFRYPGHEDVPLVDSPLGPIPEGWSVGTVGDHLRLQRGFDLPTSDRQSGAIPVVTASGVHGSHSEAKAQGPGVVTGRSGTIGVVTYIPDDYWPLNTVLWVKEFRLATPLYAYHLLGSLDLGQAAAGAAVPTLNRNHVHALPVTCPPVGLIDDWDNAARPMFAAATTLRRQTEDLVSIRDLLLPKLVTGQIDVSGLDLDSLVDSVA